MSHQGLVKRCICPTNSSCLNAINRSGRFRPRQISSHFEFWQTSSQTDFVPFLTDFVPFLTDFVPHRFRPILDRFCPNFDRFRPIFDRLCPGLLIVWEIILCYTQNYALIGIIYSVILHSVLLQPICMEHDFFEEVSTFVVWLGRFAPFAKWQHWGMAIWHVAPLRFAPAFRALGVCEHSWLRYDNYLGRNLSKMGRNLSKMGRNLFKC